MVHINTPCLNLGTCGAICVWMCLNLGISSILKQNNANLKDKSLDDVLPKFRLRAKYLQDFTWGGEGGWEFSKEFVQNSAQKNGTVQKITCLY